MEVKECPLCHSTQVKKIENDTFGDLYYCDSCNHRFRYGEEVNETVKLYNGEGGY